MLGKHWWPLLIAFAALRVLPRVIIGEDLDAGLLGNDHSFLWDMLRPLGDAYANVVSKQLMDVPDSIYSAAAVTLVLHDSRRSRWHGFGQVLLLMLLFQALMLALQLVPDSLFAMSGLIKAVLFLFVVLPAIILTFVCDAAAADERRWPLSAIGRSIELARQAPFRLLILFIVIVLLMALAKGAEALLLQAIPVTDASWFDWVTTVFQECLSGFYLPFQAAITVAAFLHLRRRHEGEKPEETAAIFD